MAAHLSVEGDVIASAGYQVLDRNIEGPVRTITRRWQGDASLAQNDTVDFVELKAGMRFLGGYIVNQDFGASETFDLGLVAVDGSGFISADGSTTADDPDFFTGTALDINSTAKKEFGVTIANNFDYELEKDCYLRGTFLGASPDVSANIVLVAYVLKNI